MRIKTDIEGYELAAYYAARSTLKHHKTGAVITDKKGNVISFGWSHHILYTEKRGWSCHAERHAIMRALPYDLDGTNIYVVTVTKHGNITTGKPCTNCQPMLDKLGMTCYHS